MTSRTPRETPRYDVENDLGWILDQQLVDAVPGTRAAVLLSGDGIRRAHSKELETADAEPMAAAASGIQALARSYAQRAMSGEEGTWEETINSYQGGFLMIVGAGDQSFLAVRADRDVDLAALTTAAHTCVLRLGEQMATPRRGADAPS